MELVKITQTQIGESNFNAVKLEIYISLFKLKLDSMIGFLGELKRQWMKKMLIISFTQI